MRIHQSGIISLALIAGVTLVQVNSPSAHAEVSPSRMKPLLSQQSTYQLAQASGTCRQVISTKGLNVRQSPTTNSEVLGVIGSERNVTIRNQGVNGWVAIAAPLEGYVYGGFLGYCEETSPPPSNCRRVQTNGVLDVLQEPTTNGVVLGSIPNGRRVTIENRGANGWVPITVPLVGYVSSNNLAYCAQ